MTLVPVEGMEIHVGGRCVWRVVRYGEVLAWLWVGG